MKTKVEKMETQVKMKLWGTHWVITPMLLVIMILWVTGNIDSLRNGNLWYVLIVGLFGSLIRILKIPMISILISIALVVLNSFGVFKTDEATIATVFFIVIGMIYDHYLLRREANQQSVSKDEKPKYLDLIGEELNKRLSYLYEKVEHDTIKLEKSNTQLEHEKKEFEEAKKFSGNTQNYEKSIQRKEINIEEMKTQITTKKGVIHDLEEALQQIQLEQKRMRLA